MVITQRLHEMHAKFARPGMGTTSSADLVFIMDCISERRPGVFVEVGVASGISSGFIGLFMKENAGKTLHCIDISDRFYADPSKPTGYLFGESCPEDGIERQLHLNKTSIDIQGILEGAKADMVFIDANHQHPWPTLDSMAVLPHIRPGGIIIHHDILLFRNDLDGIGPKHLFDAYTEFGKAVADGPYQSIGYIVSPRRHYREAESCLVRSLRVPWNRSPMREDLAIGYQNMIQKFWGDDALKAFNDGLRSTGHMVS